MSLTITQGRDEILARFKEQWDADAPAVNGGATPTVEWTGVEKLTPPPIDAAWARVTVTHVDGGQATLGGVGGRRFARRGFVTVQIFTPNNQGEGLADLLAQVAVDAFEGKDTPGGVWFRNVRASDLGDDAVNPAFTQTNVVADFEYDRVR